MNVSLTPELEDLIQRKVESGLYISASEVIREALRLLQERDRVREVHLEQLRSELQLGLDQLQRGRSKPLDGRTVRALKARGRRKLSSKRTSEVS